LTLLRNNDCAVVQPPLVALVALDSNFYHTILAQHLEVLADHARLDAKALTQKDICAVRVRLKNTQEGFSVFLTFG